MAMIFGVELNFGLNPDFSIELIVLLSRRLSQQESPANAKGTRDSSACMKTHCEHMSNP